VQAEWSGDAGSIEVHFNDSSVVRATFFFHQKEPQSPLDNFLWRAKRQWQKWFPE
jgi:hypothetical protein